MVLGPQLLPVLQFHLMNCSMILPFDHGYFKLPPHHVLSCLQSSGYAVPSARTFPLSSLAIIFRPQPKGLLLQETFNVSLTCFSWLHRREFGVCSYNSCLFCLPPQNRTLLEGRECNLLFIPKGSRALRGNTPVRIC